MIDRFIARNLSKTIDFLTKIKLTLPTVAISFEPSTYTCIAFENLKEYKKVYCTLLCSKSKRHIDDMVFCDCCSLLTNFLRNKNLLKFRDVKKIHKHRQDTDEFLLYLEGIVLSDPSCLRQAITINDLFWEAYVALSNIVEKHDLSISGQLYEYFYMHLYCTRMIKIPSVEVQKKGKKKRATPIEDFISSVTEISDSSQINESGPQNDRNMEEKKWIVSKEVVPTRYNNLGLNNCFIQQSNLMLGGYTEMETQAENKSSIRSVSYHSQLNSQATGYQAEIVNQAESYKNGAFGQLDLVYSNNDATSLGQPVNHQLSSKAYHDHLNLHVLNPELAGNDTTANNTSSDGQLPILMPDNMAIPSTFNKQPPLNINYLALTAAVYYHQKNYDKALQIFDQLSTNLYYFDLDYIDLYSNILYIKNDPRVFTLAEATLAINKYRPETMCCIANYYSMKKDHKKAIEYFKLCVKFDPSRSIVYTLIGHEYMELGKPEKALESYNLALKFGPHDYRAWYSLGQTYYTMTMYEYSMFFIKKALELKQDDSIVWTALGNCYYNTKKHNDAIRCFKQVIRLDDIEGFLLIADVYKNEKKYCEAVRFYEKYVVFNHKKDNKADTSKICSFLSEYFSKLFDEKKSKYYASLANKQEKELDIH